RAQCGFTLIEILITIFILILMLVFYVSAFSTNQLSRLQEHRDIALRVVTQKMQTLRGGGFSNVDSSTTFTDTSLSRLTNASASTTVSYYNSSLKEVIVGISWLEGSSTLYVQETTLIGNSGGL